MQQLSMFDLIRPPPMIRAVDADGHVVQGDPAETLILPHPRMAWDLARIELHPHEGAWMWSASSPVCGSYKVGVKWGRFAETKEDAAHYAAKEILRGVERQRAAGNDLTDRGITIARLGQIESWARAIADNPAAHLATEQQEAQHG